jgi:HD superfamily phosphohydrolase
MSRNKIQRIQDSVHGLMEFSGMETVVVDVLRTPELQRLRKIRQLGLVHLVFPGGEHSRLVHSLGASHLAVRFGRHIKEAAREFFAPVLCPDETVIRDLAVAALCHDLGHGPLSHAWEREMVRSFDRTAWSEALGLNPNEPALKDLKWHELVTQGLLAWEDGQLHQLLEQHEKGSSTRIRGLLSGQYDIHYIPRLLSSDVDVDRADFLKRDTHQTGVAYGRYDLDWLISTCTLGKCRHGDNTSWVVGFDRRKAIRVIEQFVIARQALYETVYQHKTVRCAEGMVANLLRRLKHLGGNFKMDVAGFVKPLVKIIHGEVLGPHELIQLDDFALFVLIDNVAHMTKQDPTAADLAQRIISRDLFKIVPVRPRQLDLFLDKPDARQILYKAIKPFCVGEPEYYLVEDTVEFNMMSKDDSTKVYLIDVENSERQAIPAHEDDALRQYEQIKNFSKRIYTIPGAVEVVRKVVEQA